MLVAHAVCHGTAVDAPEWFEVEGGVVAVQGQRWHGVVARSARAIDAGMQRVAGVVEGSANGASHR